MCCNPKNSNEMVEYLVLCPKCGHVFSIKKGITLQECASGKPVPKSRNEDEPDYCPKCHHKMSDEDEHLGLCGGIMYD